MLRRCFTVSLFIGFSLTASFVASAQEVVHALSGTVTAINPAAKTIVINTNDGSFGLFKEQIKSDVPLLFENELRSRTMPADTFKDKGAQVIVYYFGGGFGQSGDRTVVALQNLGAGPIEKDTGTVVKFNKHALTIKTGSGAEENFQIGDTAVAETATGAVRAERFDPGKGEQVRVIAALDNGQKTVLFVREM